MSAIRQYAVATPMEEFPAPQEPHPPLGRTRHPYFMHEMIRRQAVASRATLGTAPEVARTIEAPAKGSPILFVGIGTSYHAALGAHAMARGLLGSAASLRPVSSFDLLDDPANAEGAAHALIFSSSGDTALTVRSMQSLRERGVPTTLITGTEASPSTALADHVLRTRYAEETSWAHTVSYTAALCAALVLLRHWAGVPELPDGEEDPISEAVVSGLATENPIVEAVERFAERPTLVVLGSGPAEVTAREAALKLREAAGRFVATGGVEEFLHGMIPSVTDRSGVLAVAGTTFERARAEQGLRAVRELGASTLLIDSSGGPAEEGVLSILPMAPSIAIIHQIIPLQLLAYWLATSEGRNPDVMGLDDVRYLAARRSFGI
ncbi:MAG: SIS domain-containing protein [Thermoplasmata archaeon]|nr:SIS domain-containing protein [Thermoplasmata archaeon]